MISDCRQCGTPFVKKTQNAVFCSSECRMSFEVIAKKQRRLNNPEEYRAIGREAYHRNKHRYKKPPRPQACKQCLGMFVPLAKGSEYCSIPCKVLAVRRLSRIYKRLHPQERASKAAIVECIWCGSSFARSRFRSCCSTACSEAHKRDYYKKYYQDKKNRDKRSEYGKQYYTENRERLRELYYIRYHKNRDEVIIRQKEYINMVQAAVAVAMDMGIYDDNMEEDRSVRKVRERAVARVIFELVRDEALDDVTTASERKTNGDHSS